MIIFISETDNNEELIRMSYIYNSVQFQKEQIQALLDRNSEMNSISLDFIWKLSFNIEKTNIRAQKIDGSTLNNFKMRTADF